MPDKWEYPWFAAWDTAFQMLPMSRVDPYFAKDQLTLLLREWFMHPNGQLPAYEGSFSDVNPPVHAWACWRVYKLCDRPGPCGRQFLASTFQKLLMNFTWWVNRKDPTGNNIFGGGFLGMDNIGVFDRDKPLPSGQLLEEADGTAWMAFYSVTMLAIALELAGEDSAYEDTASKFFAHFVSIADAMNSLGGSGLWDEQDGFYYDQIMVDQQPQRLKVRSLVGLIPLIAVEVLEEGDIQGLSGFANRLKWFMDNRADLYKQISYMESRKDHGHIHRLLAIPSRERLVRVLGYMLDEKEFLSPYGIRSLSKYHQEHPFTFESDGQSHRICYEPGEAQSDLFGGNSNWRGPIWMPINLLLLEALQRYHHFYGDTLKVECPTGSGYMINLRQVACEIAHRLCLLFLPDRSGRRPWQGGLKQYIQDPHWKNLTCFHEYFHGDTGEGLGAAHQTGWTALIVHLLETVADERGCGG